LEVGTAEIILKAKMQIGAIYQYLKHCFFIIFRHILKELNVKTVFKVELKITEKT